LRTRVPAQLTLDSDQITRLVQTARHHDTRHRDVSEIVLDLDPCTQAQVDLRSQLRGKLGNGTGFPRQMSHIFLE